MSNVESFRCPNCNAPIKLNENKCSFCNTEYIITSLSFLVGYETSKINKYIAFYKEQLIKNPQDGTVHLALGICYLDLALEELAQKYLKQAIELNPEMSETYFYYAISLIGDKKIKILPSFVVKEIEKYLDAAIKINPLKSSHQYFKAILKYEFYIKNGMRCQPPIEEILSNADKLEYDNKEMEKIVERLNIDDESIRSKVLK